MERPPLQVWLTPWDEMPNERNAALIEASSNALTGLFWGESTVMTYIVAFPVYGARHRHRVPMQGSTLIEMYEMCLL